MCEHKYDKECDVRYADLGVFVKDWKALDRRLSMTDETNACILCGRDTSTQKNYFYTIGLGSPYHASHKDDYDNCERSGGFMGEYPIGSECVKKVIKAGFGDYVYKSNK
tara:strand:- start:952 stop:1278 length:327 start_codon:yes stop_codon:yes gene_type:complete